MDRIKAHELESALKGREVGGYTIDKLIDNGKSAAVFRALKNGERAAVKIFDDELIEKYGDKTQLGRIERELTLIGHNEPYLVKILDGGFDKISENHYIVMDFLEGPNLKKCLLDIPNEYVPKLISQLAAAAQFLERRNLVHRDIKPENIILLEDYTKLVLLDLGVVRPIGKPGLTDDDGIKPFVGTLQYSSPEFLLRQEKDNIEGWRALTFYQIGGVLHDLIMRKALFSEFSEPYARLVMAIQQEQPTVHSSSVPSYLVDLAKRCLLKNPDHRIRFVRWDEFKVPDNIPVTSAKDVVTKRAALARVSEGIPVENSELKSASRLKAVIVNDLKVSARSIRGGDLALPPITATPFSGGQSGICIAFDASVQDELPHGLYIYLKIEVLDAVAKAVVIRGLAAVQKQQSETIAFNSSMFEGIYDLPTVYQHFEDFVYGAVLWAQTKEVTSVDAHWPLPT